ncbi:MAG: lipopolysaccharide transport periplasmic protein LptA [Pseudomonadota bacterium]
MKQARVIVVVSLLVALALPGIVLNAAPTFAQSADAFAGFSSDNNQPIQIEADSLEVRDEEKLAIFKGNVDVQQGPTTMKAAKLNVFYDGAVNTAGGNQGIRRIEALGKIWVNTGDNTATGDRAIFNMKTQIVELIGNVVLTQCDNIIRGKKLTVNLTTSQAQLSGTGRVQALFDTSQNNTGARRNCQ